MNSFSALYVPKEKTKKINGFTYTQASNLVKNYLNSNFDEVRLDIKGDTTSHLKNLANLLHIDDLAKEQKFMSVLKSRYIELYEELVVVSVMILK